MEQISQFTQLLLVIDPVKAYSAIAIELETVVL